MVLIPYHSFSALESPALPSFSIHGDENWGLFGKVVEVGDVDGDGMDDVVVSAPQAGNGNDDKSNTGIVYVFDSSIFKDGKGGKAGELAKEVIRGEGERVHFGQSLDIESGTGRIAVGSPYHHVEGKDAVGKVEMIEVKGGERVWTLVGCDHGGVVGGSLRFGKGGKLAIAEAGHNRTAHQLRSGRVTVLDVGELEGRVEFEPHNAGGFLGKLKLCNEARFGEAME